MDRVSTLYRQRERTAGRVARALLRLVENRRGNYLLFFPSYAYMRRIHREFASVAPQVRTQVQEPGMEESRREEFLENFSAENGETLAGFVLMGGIFGEGIDLVGDRLTGAAVVGVGLPGICPERELIRAYFEASEAAGFDFAYLYPGIHRVLQAAGRVIRSEGDRGTVVLMDRRYGTGRYRSLLPTHWRLRPVGNADSFDDALQRFWRQEAG
jgi:DNA excision repair protein ERCC-2